MASKYKGCAVCGSANIIPEDSLEGMEMKRRLYEAAKAKAERIRQEMDDW